MARLLFLSRVAAGQTAADLLDSYTSPVCFFLGLVREVGCRIDPGQQQEERACTTVFAWNEKFTENKVNRSGSFGKSRGRAHILSGLFVHYVRGSFRSSSSYSFSGAQPTKMCFVTRRRELK